MSTIDLDRARLSIQQSIDSLGPVLDLNTALRKQPDVVAGYGDFLRPFLVVENAAVVAVTGADPASAEWKSLDPTDLNRAVDIKNSLAGIDILLDFYQGEDYRQLPIFNLIDFAKLFAHPDPLDRQTVVANLEASLARNCDVEIYELDAGRLVRLSIGLVPTHDTRQVSRNILVDGGGLVKKQKTRLFDTRWKEFLTEVQQEKIVSHPEVKAYLGELGLKVTEDGLSV